MGHSERLAAGFAPALTAGPALNQTGGDHGGILHRAATCLALLGRALRRLAEVQD